MGECNMLSTIIKWGRKILILLIMGFLLSTNIGYTQGNDYIKWNVNETIVASQMQQRECQVVIRVGEYEGKPGKRVYLDDIGLYFKDIPADIKIHKDNRGAYIHEYDLNKKISKRIYDELVNKGIKVKYQDTKDRTEDLNRAGRIANESNAKIYLSIHTNYYDNNSSGFFIMSNKGDTQARLIADRLSNSIENNGMIKRRNALLNEGRIGELNEIKDETIALLLEAGFYSNPNELKHLMSDNYSSYIATHFADELVEILNELR
jgi:hypothetical protein